MSKLPSIYLGKIILKNNEQQYYIMENIYQQKIFKAYDIPNERFVAIKVIKYLNIIHQVIPKHHLLQKEELKKYYETEKKIQEKIDSPYVIKLLSQQVTETSIHLIYEYCEQGSLQDYLNKTKILDYKTAFNIFYQIIQSWKVLKDHQYMHRDLKPANFFIKDGQIKISDLGSAYDYSNLDSEQAFEYSRIGTYGYMSPEVIQGVYNTKVDIFSLGVIFIQMINGEHPYLSERDQEDILLNLIDEKQVLEIMKDKKIVFKQKLPNSMQNLIHKMIDFNVEQRISIDEVILEIERIKKSSQIEKKKFGDINYYSILTSQSILKQNQLQEKQVQLKEINKDVLTKFQKDILNIQEQKSKMDDYISQCHHQLQKLIHWIYTQEKIKKYVDFKNNSQLQIAYWIIVLQLIIMWEKCYQSKKNQEPFLKTDISMEILQQHQAYQKIEQFLSNLLLSKEGYASSLKFLQLEVLEFLKYQDKQVNKEENLIKLLDTPQKLNEPEVKQAYSFYIKIFYKTMKEFNFSEDKKHKLKYLKILLAVGYEYNNQSNKLDFAKFQLDKQVFKQQEIQNKDSNAYKKFIEKYYETAEEIMKN